MRRLKTILLWLLGAMAALILYDSFMPPVSTLMLADGLSLQHVDRRWVPLSRMSPQLPRAVIAAEDGKFCSHDGVDWEALHHAVKEAVDEDDESHGASTVTMQVVKNLFLWPGRSYIRKGIEIPSALFIDAIWSKRRIMEVYLNIAQFGDGIYGAEAAARHYFGKPASALTARESALLAAILPNPLRRNPARPSAYVNRYANTIAARLGIGVASGCLRQ